MNSKTQSSRATARPTLLDSTAARLGAALGLVGIGGALLLVSAVGDSGQSGMLPGIGLIFALLAALLLSLWINDRNNRRLIELFERISRDPDAALDLPLEQHATTDECRRMIDSYARLMAHMQASQQRLRDSETRFRTMFEQSPYALQLFTPDGEHLHANRAFLELWGFALVEQINGFNILRDQQLAAAGLLPYIQRGFAGETTTVPAMRYDPAQVPSIRDGRPRWVQSVVYPIKDAAGTTREVAVVFEDITERVQAYETLEQGVAERTHELSTLLEVSHNVASTLELKPLLGLILDQLQKVVDYTAATIYIVENDRLVVQDYRRPIAENTVVPFSYPLDRIGMLWEALRAGEPVIIADTRADTPLARFYQSIMGQQLYAELSYIRSWMGVPLLLKERVIGVLVVSHNVPDHFTPRHGRLALAIANQAAVAIENAKLFEQAQGLAALMERQRLARELHDSVSQALYGIALGARTARTLLDRDPSRLAEPLDYVLSLAEAGLTEMRALIFELRPESLELEG
ncbi:MAG TPA: histidine kinase, partial [Herpetosiphonaceae bacterium]